MTPRPADEARRALREARGLGEGAPAPTTAPDAYADADLTDGEQTQEQSWHRHRHRQQNPNPTSSENPIASENLIESQVRDREREEPTAPRPGDIARAALRGARTGRQAAADGGTGTGNAAGKTGAPRAARPDATSDSPSSTPGTLGTPEEEVDGPAEVTSAARATVPGLASVTPSPADHCDDAADPSSTAASRPGEATAPEPASPPTGATPAARSGSFDEGDSRPADVAREALRAARRQAAKPDAAARSTESTRRLSRPARRPPGADGPRTADTRARVVRDFAADAFRLPPEADLAGEPLPPAEPAPSPASLATPAPTPTSTPGSTPTSSHESASLPPPQQQAAPGGASPAAAAHGQVSATPPAAPRTPRAPGSMAAPGRDGEHRRTFPALPPPRTADEDFARTWWGNAWVTALEEGALDAARLARGRGYAVRGNVDAITVTPGLVLAYVQGSRPRPYRVQVRLRTLGDDDWQRFLDAAVERPGHIAALLDKELPRSLADCGVPLLPGPGDLAPQCGCPDSGHPCKHAAALCYQTARLLDADPFVLLLLRGRGERELLDALARLNAARAARAAQDRGPAPLPGVRAGAALAAPIRPPLPAPLPAPPHPEQPPAYPAAPGGPDPFALDQLATDAAARAHALLTTGRDPVGGLTPWQDAVRLAAARPGSGLTAGTRALYASLAKATGRGSTELARAVAAWRQGGPEGLDVLEEPWDPPAGRFDRARSLLLAADLPAFRPRRNRLTHPQGHVQLRLGRAGLWYAYESEPGREDWWPRGTPDLDPVGALTGLGAPGDP